LRSENSRHQIMSPHRRNNVQSPPSWVPTRNSLPANTNRSLTRVWVFMVANPFACHRRFQTRRSERRSLGLSRLVFRSSSSSLLFGTPGAADGNSGAMRFQILGLVWPGRRLVIQVATGPVRHFGHRWPTGRHRGPLGLLANTATTDSCSFGPGRASEGIFQRPACMDVSVECKTRLVFHVDPRFRFAWPSFVWPARGWRRCRRVAGNASRWGFDFSQNIGVRFHTRPTLQPILASDRRRGSGASLYSVSSFPRVRRSARVLLRVSLAEILASRSEARVSAVVRSISDLGAASRLQGLRCDGLPFRIPPDSVKPLQRAAEFFGLSAFGKRSVRRFARSRNNPAF